MVKIFEFWKNQSTHYYEVKTVAELLNVVPHLFKNSQLLEKIEIFDEKGKLIWPRGKNSHTWKDLAKHLQK